MARNGSGTYTVPNSFTPSTTIDSSDVNQNFTDLGDEMTNSLAIDGQSVMTGQLKAANGSNTTPSLSFGADLDTGFYRKASNQIGIGLGGTEVGYFDATGPVFSPGIPTASIADDAITYAKIQNVSATDKILGRSTSGAGNVEEIACTSAGRALIDDANASAQRTTLGLGTSAVLDTGTSGTKVPLLDGSNTHSGDNIFSGANTFSNSNGITAKNASKAYAYFSQSGTTVTFTASNYFNIASIVRTGAGTYTVTFTGALPTANYVVVGQGNSGIGTSPRSIIASSRGTSSFTLTTVNSNGGVADVTEAEFAVLGF